MLNAIVRIPTSSVVQHLSSRHMYVRVIRKGKNKQTAARFVVAAGELRVSCFENECV